nr:retrovirus-related Pol polyprotein from transposon TNT 1-94 [Tanacetum cinerariifolium]
MKDLPCVVVSENEGNRRKAMGNMPTDDDDDEEDEGDDGQEGNGDDDNENDDGEEGDDDDADQEVVRDDDKDDEEEGGDDEHEFDEDESDEETKDEENFDPIPQTLKNSEDEGNGKEDLGLNIGMESIFETTSQLDVQSPTSEAPLPMFAPTMTPSTIATITTTSQAPILPTTVLSNIIQNLRSFGSVFRFDDRLRSLEANFSEAMQMNQFAGAVSAILEIVQRYMDQRMNEAVKVAIQIQSDHLLDEAQRENDEFLKTVDENIKKIIKEQVKEQVKTSYPVVADLSEMELKKILIEKMKGNKSIQRSDEQMNLYKALVEAYESDKIILDTYGETVTLKRRRDDDADKDEEPFAGPDQGTRPGVKEIPTQGSRSRQASASESALAEEPMQTTSQMEEPSYLEFDTGAKDQPIIQSSQHPEWFSQQQKPPSLNRDWNKTVPAVHESIQPWISELAKQADTRSSFNELIDTPLDFFNFLINQLKVDTLTPELLAGPTYELMKGSCKSLVELKYHLEEVFKATTDQLDWVNPEGQQTMWIEELIGYDKHALWGRKIIAILELKIIEWHSYKHLDWITVRRDDDKLYKFKEGDFKRLRIQDIEDMLLLLVQGNLTNLTVKERFAFNVSIRMFTRSIVIQRSVEDLQLGRRMLTDVRNVLDDRLKGIQMQYLPQLIWRKSDKDRVAAMIQAIDKRVKTRRIMRSLEQFVGGRLSILTDLQVTPTKPGRMTKPYSSHCFIANCFNTGNIKIEVKVRGDHEVELTDEESPDSDREDEVAEIFRIETNVFDFETPLSEVSGWVFTHLTDFASWQQRIRLYSRGKDNGVNILKSIDEGTYKLGTFRETLAESTEGTPQFGSERPQDRESQLYDDFEHFKQHKEESVHDYYVRFAKVIKDMRNIKMTMSKLQLNSKFVNNMLPEWGGLDNAFDDDVDEQPVQDWHST